jgi:hypothetical protein
MSDRVTIANVRSALANLNRRMERADSLYRYSVERRYDYIALDRVIASTGVTVSDAVVAGTKREVYKALCYMMVALDDAETRDHARDEAIS